MTIPPTAHRYVFGNIQIDPELNVTKNNDVEIQVTITDLDSGDVIEQFVLQSHEEYEQLVQEYEKLAQGDE